MYTEEEERKGLPIKTFLISLILIIIFVLLLVWLLPMPNMDGLNNRIFNANIQEMKDAAIPYFTTDKLPQNVGDEVKLTLQEMIDMKLLFPFTDKNGDACDTEKSYVILTKKEDHYELKVNLKCNEEEDYIIVTLGCYSYCTSAICEKEPEQKPTPSPKPTPKPSPVVSGPSCVLYVENGTLGQNGWYTSNATVKFKSKTTGSNASIVNYGLSTGSTTYNGNNTLTVTSEGKTTVYGYVKDSNGKTATCSIVVKKDTQKPNCTLQVTSGTKGSDGTYNSNVTIGFGSKTDATSGINAYGITNSTKATYNNQTSYVVSTNGSHKIYGYVKDQAGNTATCNISVTRNAKQDSVPSCTLKVTSGKAGTNGWYVGNVTVAFETKKSTNGATISSYGIGTSQKYDGTNTYTVSADGTTTVYGYVKDSNGKTATCSIVVKKDTTAPKCSLSVLSGSQASDGTYNSNVTVGFGSKTDATSGINAYGVTNSSTVNYNSKTSYTVTTNGTHTIYGFVKDQAGNTATCNVSVTRKISTASTPSCTLKVTSGKAGTNGWYVGNVTVAFETKKSTNGATISSYGIGTSQKYDGTNTYTVSADGTTTVYGYVKDTNGNTATCSLVVKKDATVPKCSLKVTNGTYNSNGYYTSNITIGFGSKTDATSGILKYGLGTSEAYNNNSSYEITTVGKHTIYGYVMDNAGNKATCSLTVEKRNNLEYQYKKDIAAQYSAWSDWKTYTYLPSDAPKFGNFALYEVVDLGKTQEVDYYNYSVGDPIYKTTQVKIGTVKQTYCAGYKYYRTTTSTTTTTYAVADTEDWVYQGRITTTGYPTDTLTVKYEFVGFVWPDDCATCTTASYKVFNKYTRKVGTVSSQNTVTTNGVTATCAKTETKEVEIFANAKEVVGYEKIRTAVMRDVYRYKQRTRTLIQKAYTDYKWSYYNDQNLIGQGYTLTGATRVAN